MIYEKLALYHPSIPQNKCSTNFVGLSLQLSIKKMRHGLSKKIWTNEGPSIGKKRGPMKVPEKKERKKKKKR
jgi:hypothetical protein